MLSQRLSWQPVHMDVPCGPMQELKITGQQSFVDGTSTHYLTSYTAFRAHALSCALSYMTEQLRMRGWSGHCLWREGKDQWELIAVADTSVRPPATTVFHFATLIPERK